MSDENKNNLTDCKSCRTAFDARQRFCPQCNFEIAAGSEFRLPLIVYPILIMFGICLLYFVLR